MAIKKGDTVFYVASRGLGEIVKARVIVAHKGGAAKVEAGFFFEDGRDSGPYIGAQHELAAAEIHRNAMEADIYRSVARALAREDA